MICDGLLSVFPLFYGGCFDNNLLPNKKQKREKSNKSKHVTKQKKQNKSKSNKNFIKTHSNPPHPISSPPFRRYGALELLSVEQLQTIAASICHTHAPSSEKAALIAHIRSGAAQGHYTKGGGHLLKNVFPSWPRLHHQREHTRPYLGKSVNVLELGPFEVELGGLERPFVCNVSFCPDMPLRPDGQPDIRIGKDIARRSHYLGAEDALFSSLDAKVHRVGADLSKVAPYGSVPQVKDRSPIAGSGRLYPDDKIKFGWVVQNGEIVSQPKTALSNVKDMVESQYNERKASSESRRGNVALRAVPSAGVERNSTKKAAKKGPKWSGWK